MIIWRPWCAKRVSQAWMCNCIPQNILGCNYLSLPEIRICSSFCTPAWSHSSLKHWLNEHFTGIKHIWFAAMFHGMVQVFITCFWRQSPHIHIKLRGENSQSGANQRKHQSSAPLNLYEGYSPVTGKFPAQMARNAENISISCRHHDFTLYMDESPYNKTYEH